MDKVDLQIIEELKIDSRMSFTKIAEKIGISTQTVINRYNRMVLQKVIRSNSISIDLKKIGYVGTLHVFLEIHPSKNPTEIINKLAQIENIIVASRATGDYEGYAVSVFRNVNQLYKQVLIIKQITGIRELEFFIATPGFEYFPSPNTRPKNPDFVKLSQ